MPKMNSSLFKIAFCIRAAMSKSAIHTAQHFARVTRCRSRVNESGQATHGAAHKWRTEIVINKVVTAIYEFTVEIIFESKNIVHLSELKGSIAA